MLQHHRAFFIDGRWTPAADADAIEVINPYTQGVIGSVPEATATEVDAAVAAARRAFDGWSTTAPARRSALLEQLELALARRGDELAALITAEVGTPIKMSQRLQVGLPLGTLALTRRVLDEFQFEESLGNSLLVREPIGVVACITPWNYPLHQIVCKVAPALAAGCTVVLKPSEVAPLNAFVLAEEVAAVGFPPGVFNLVTGRGAATGEHLVHHADVDMVSFTGSTRAGKRISQLAAETVKRVTLELGGKSASVVLDDADFAAAVKTTVNMCLLNAGQTCAALTRLLVPESRYAEAARIAVATASSFVPGDPSSDKTRLGPLTSRHQRDRVSDYIRQGVDSGLELLLGGVPPPIAEGGGYFVEPTIFGRVPPDHVLAQEEVFGPVLCIMTYHDEDEAVAIANGTPYGLAAAVWSASEERAARVARRLRAGQVDLNGAPFNASAPFGGYRQSGNGKENGRFGFEEMLEIKALQFKP
jgi:betaine-aldehyde dehydrogenase